MAHPAIASPIRLSHQGRLLDEAGAPLEGEHELTARLVTEAGDLLWSDSVPTVFQHGYYHLVLGDHAPLDDGLFRGGAPLFELSVDGGAPIPVEGPLTHVPYAAVAEWAREAHSVHGGIVDASEVRVNGQTVLQAGATTTLGRVRADQGLQLGAAATAACEAGTRGLLRYVASGELELCSLDGWVEVGASESGTCSIVGECPGGGEPSLVYIGDLSIYTPEGAQAFCSRYDRVHGGLGIGLSDNAPATFDLACVRGTVNRANNSSMATDSKLLLNGLEGVDRDAEFHGDVELDALRFVGISLSLRDLPATSTFPSLQSVGGGLAWTWATGVTDSAPLHDFMPALESVGASLTGSSPITGSSIGPRVPLPSLTTVGGEYYAPSVDAPNLREIGGALVLSGPQPPFPSLEVVGALTAGGPLASVISRIQTPFPLSSLASLRAVQGPLTIHCVRGWSQSDLESFVDRIGRDNIVGPISIVGTESALCVG